MSPRRRVTMIGIAGDSGAGKSTYVEHLKRLLSEDRVTVISGDDYHSLDRVERSKIGVTALDPWKANNLGLLADHVWALKQGKSIVKPIYDHSTGTFNGSEKIEPREIVFLEGLHMLYLKNIREALDLKIYLDTDIALRVRWKVKRDADFRGYTEAEVLKEIERRKPDVEKFIEPQKSWADLVIHYFPDLQHESSEEVPDPIRVTISERTKVRKRRLVKWLAIAGQLGWINAKHSHEELGGEEIEIASISGNTNLSSVHSLLELISPDPDIAYHIEDSYYSPVSMSHLLIANMISEECYKGKEENFWSRQPI